MFCPWWLHQNTEHAADSAYIGNSSFDEYMRSALNSATRSKLRKKFRATEMTYRLNYP